MAQKASDHQTDEGGNEEKINCGRRSILAASGVALATAVGVPIGSAEEHEDEFTEEEILTLLEIVIEGEGIEIAELEIEEEGLQDSRILSFEYYPLGTTEEEIGEEIGYATGAFAEAVNMGLEAERLEATALDLAGEPISEWYIEREWAEAYNADEMSAVEVAIEALATLEPVEE
ncbi:hypothetical protein [Natronorubrum texcoconense]|uniref:DUF8159 domain-containing protein n=1 Tax=Natronorubrum texcoconense TaxID=1095776 RepID=A0A1G8VGR3_9EURY|nr:hypothetical protein [Natronorubrum texcoconense]SDJ65213.1 hypothetical protein SAMN04515672_1333 [Natronorubrum texcoconense]